LSSSAQLHLGALFCYGPALFCQFLDGSKNIRPPPHFPLARPGCPESLRVVAELLIFSRLFPFRIFFRRCLFSHAANFRGPGGPSPIFARSPCWTTFLYAVSCSFFWSSAGIFSRRQNFRTAPYFFRHCPQKGF